MTGATFDKFGENVLMLIIGFVDTDWRNIIDDFATYELKQ